jgi:uncharacterized membrane protein (DUF373 family)
MVVQVEPERTGQEKRRLRLFRKTAEAWPGLGLYERFEQAVALVLAFLVSGVIVVAIAHLVLAVGLHLFFNLLAPLDHAVFQDIFGMIMTVLIALEFNHTILSILHRKESIVQLRTVILIALLAMARKFIIIDVTAVEPLTVIGLAFAILALGSVYWLVRDQDRRQAAEETTATH